MKENAIILLEVKTLSNKYRIIRLDRINPVQSYFLEEYIDEKWVKTITMSCYGNILYELFKKLDENDEYNKAVFNDTLKYIKVNNPKIIISPA